MNPLPVCPSEQVKGCGVRREAGVALRARSWFGSLSFGIHTGRRMLAHLVGRSDASSADPKTPSPRGIFAWIRYSLLPAPSHSGNQCSDYISIKSVVYHSVHDLRTRGWNRVTHEMADPHCNPACQKTAGTAYRETVNIHTPRSVKKSTRC